MPQNGEFSESGTETVVVSITRAPLGGIDTGGNGIEFSLIFSGDAGKYSVYRHVATTTYLTQDKEVYMEFR